MVEPPTPGPPPLPTFDHTDHTPMTTTNADHEVRSQEAAEVANGLTTLTIVLCNGDVSVAIAATLQSLADLYTMRKPNTGTRTTLRADLQRHVGKFYDCFAEARNFGLPD